eukprot:470386-Karenia_brevis.AAC.1
MMMMMMMMTTMWWSWQFSPPSTTIQPQGWPGGATLQRFACARVQAWAQPNRSGHETAKYGSPGSQNAGEEPP